MRRVLFVCFLIVCATAAPASAFPIVWQFNGTATLQNFLAPGPVTGPLQLIFSFDSTAPDNCDRFAGASPIASVYYLGPAQGVFGSTPFTTDAYMELNAFDGNCFGNPPFIPNASFLRMPGFGGFIGNTAGLVFLPFSPDGAIITELPPEGIGMSGVVINATGTLRAVPEPTTLLLFGSGAALLARRRRA